MIGRYEVSPRQTNAPADLGERLRSTLDELHAAAKREDWARGQVRRAGEDWATHLAKFDGTVFPREVRQDPPGSWPHEESFPFGTK